MASMDATRVRTGGREASRRWQGRRAVGGIKFLSTRLENFLIFSARQDLPLSWRQIAQPKISDAHAKQAQGRVTDRGGHFADLAIFSFHQFQRNPAVLDGLPKTNRRIARRDDRLRIKDASVAGECFAAFDHDATFQFTQLFHRWNPLDLRPIFPLMSLTGVKQLPVQLRLIAHEQQAFGIGVEPANGPYLLRKTELRKGAVL